MTPVAPDDQTVCAPDESVTGIVADDTTAAPEVKVSTAVDTSSPVAGDDTTVIPRSEAVTPLAWSQEQTQDDVAPYTGTARSWQQTLGISAGILTAAALATALFGMVHTTDTTAAMVTTQPTTHTEGALSAETMTETPAPPVMHSCDQAVCPLPNPWSPPDTSVAAPAAPSWQTQDRQYLTLARLDGVPGAAPARGRMHCRALESGEEDPSRLTDHEKPVVYDWLDVYCPEIDPRGSAAVAANLSRAQ